MPIVSLPLANALFNLASAGVALLVFAFARRAFTITGSRNLLYTSIGFALFAFAQFTAAIAALYVLATSDPTPDRAATFALSQGTFYVATTLGFLALVLAHLPSGRQPSATAVVPPAVIVLAGFLNFVLAFVLVAFGVANYVERKSRSALLMGLGFGLLLLAQAIFLMDGLALSPPDLIGDLLTLAGYAVIASVLRGLKTPG